VLFIRDENFLQNIATFATPKIFLLSHLKTQTKVGEKGKITQFLSPVFSLPFLFHLARDFPI
jgi:hypothetical protein